MTRFRRVDRILCTRDFKRVTRSGRRQTSESFIVVIKSRTNANTDSTDENRKKLGVTVGKKLGNAVIRNRVKRYIREWFRHARERLPERSDVVVIARRTARDLSGSEVVAVLDRVIDGPQVWRGRPNDSGISINRVGTKIVLWLLQLYQVSLSALFGPACRFEPSCSRYAAEVIAERGFLQGFWLAVRRVARCHPLGGSGYDPIPGRVDDGP